jgi:hypothetical protein
MTKLNSVSPLASRRLLRQVRASHERKAQARKCQPGNFRLRESQVAESKVIGRWSRSRSGAKISAEFVKIHDSTGKPGISGNFQPEFPAPL